MINMSEIQKIKNNVKTDIHILPAGKIISNGVIVGGNEPTISNMVEEVNITPTPTETETETVEPVPTNVENQNLTIITGLHQTNGNTTYSMSEADFKKIAFVVNHECNGTYEDALGVISVILNRIEDGRYNASTPLEIVTQPGQFAVWNEEQAHSFQLENLKSPYVLNALNDALNNGIRNNDYIEFKASNSSDYDRNGELKVQLVAGGNKYHRVAQHVNRINNNL